ncbi:unnamed protein product [Paramecium octaurelia]|uniref:Uncharacterized protein n=1 Tax=Paramecium octaurelia TaxID=43137 RepID=A0A8S1Y055_PAROT|nr:unnamed protein product [Paramecium octaurelia]
MINSYSFNEYTVIQNKIKDQGWVFESQISQFHKGIIGNTEHYLFLFADFGLFPIFNVFNEIAINSTSLFKFSIDFVVCQDGIGGEKLQWLIGLDIGCLFCEFGLDLESSSLSSSNSTSGRSNSVPLQNSLLSWEGYNLSAICLLKIRGQIGSLSINEIASLGFNYVSGMRTLAFQFGEYDANYFLGIRHKKLY